MAYRGKSILAVVPARGGSKGIPKKNLRAIGGRSLVGWAAKICVETEWIDRSIISSDDKTICSEAVLNGLDCFFERPAELSGDTATSLEVWRHAFLAAEEYYGESFDISLLLEPTSPCRKTSDLASAVDKIIIDNYQAAATLSATRGSFTPHKTLTVESSGEVKFYLQEGPHYSIRQKIPPYYHRNGICYAAERETLLNLSYVNILQSRCCGVVINRPVVNIDEFIDLELAELIFAKNDSN